MNILLHAVMLMLAIFIGFASHRASLCTVRAVAELLGSRQGYVLASFAKATAWVSMIYGTLMLLLPASAPTTFPVYEPRLLALAGGFLFGVGAAINRGCSLSTLQRLAEGDLWMLLTFAGLGTGILAWSALGLAHIHAVAAPLVWPQLGHWGTVLLAVLWLLALRELMRLWRSRPPQLPFWQLPNVPAYRLSTSALIIGVSGGLLYGLQGAWSYSSYLRSSIESAHRHGIPPEHFQAWLFAALIAGMVLSALQRGSFRLRLDRGDNGLLQRYAGGTIMGFGAAMIPGGNDTLILTGIPTLSVWALGAYLALLLGIATTLAVMRMTRGPLPRMECVNDVCIEQESATGNNGKPA